jgi:hypothetical protein
MKSITQSGITTLSGQGAYALRLIAPNPSSLQLWHRAKLYAKVALAYQVRKLSSVRASDACVGTS